MTAPKLIVRPATRDDIETYSDLEHNPSTRAWVGKIDQKIVGLGGVALVNKRWFAFLDLEDEALSHKMTIMRAAIRFLNEQKRRGVRFIFAEVDRTKPNAEKWLASLGFELDPISQHLFRWKA